MIFKSKLDSSISVVFVLGLYKTGTSLMVELLSTSGFLNIANENNSNEHANGLTGRYYTNECRDIRRVNKLIIETVPFGANIIDFPDVVMAISNYLNAQIEPIVIKDPRFVYTLEHWIAVCTILNKKYKVFSTIRLKEQLETAWNEAYFTKSLLKKDSNVLEKMNSFHLYQKNMLLNQNGNYYEYSLEQLKLYKGINQLDEKIEPFSR